MRRSVNRRQVLGIDYGHKKLLGAQGIMAMGFIKGTTPPMLYVFNTSRILEKG